MYLEFFGLQAKPFALTPNPAFLVQLAPYRACLNLLRVALAEGEGFVKITGEVGTGKTLLCRAFLNSLNRGRYQPAWLPNSGLTPLQLQQALLCELQAPGEPLPEPHALLDALNRRLIELAAAGKSTVLLIDEAQALPPETLEAVRLLTNLETERRKLLQVVLFGQPELDRLLERPEFRQMRQRITFSYCLEPLDRHETEQYLNQRLAQAGYRGAPLFAPGALRLLVSGSGGIPRLINILANKALMVAFGQGRRQVGAGHVRRALRDTEGARPFLRRLPPLADLLLWGLLTLALLLFLLSGWLWWQERVP